MQIGTGNNNRLPGSSLTENEVAPVAPPLPDPVVQESGAITDPPAGKKWLWLVAGLLLLAAAGVCWGITRGGGAFAEVKQFAARAMAAIPGLNLAAFSTTNRVELTAAQQKAVAEYSPVKAINETKRVKALARERVTGAEADAADSHAPVVAATPSNALPAPVATPPPVPVATAKPPATAVATAVVARTRAEPWPEIQVTATIGGANTKWYARINGQLVKVGDPVDRARVTEISADCVTLELNGEQRSFHAGARR